MAVAACPASALAAQRFASPGGSFIAPCTVLNPCSIDKAINFANTNDEVILAGDQGTYGSPGTPISTTLIASTHPVNIHGAAGQPRPVIYSSATLGLDAISADTVSDLTIIKLGIGTVMEGGNATVDHAVFAGTDPTANGCNLFAGATLTDSICDAGGTAVNTGSGCGSPCTFTDTLRNDTVIGGNRGIVDTAGGFDTENVPVTNTIVSGGTKDVVADSSGGVAANVTLDHSNYRTTDSSAGGTITPAGSGSNQTAAPAFVNAGAFDFHEAAGSPTIDAGVTDPLNGATDLDGNPRTLGSSTDIGAYEFIPPAQPQPGTTPGPTGLRAAALARCKKRAKKHHWSHKRRKKCRKRAKLLPL